MSSENEAKQIIRSRIKRALGECVIPELGPVKKGKVRDIYISDDKVIMVASDRVSAFDYVLDNLIPFKGQVLNELTRWAFANTPMWCLAQWWMTASIQM